MLSVGNERVRSGRGGKLLVIVGVVEVEGVDVGCSTGWVGMGRNLVEGLMMEREIQHLCEAV